MRATRIVLFAVGALAVVFGVWSLLSTQRPDQVVLVAVWLLGAIIVHDFVLVPLITVAARAAGRTRDRSRSRSK